MSYEHADLEVSLDKSYRFQTCFQAWGTEVDFRSGNVGAPILKRVQIAHLILQMLHLDHVTLKLLQRIMGLLIHPFQHRRILLSLFSCVFEWMAELKPYKKYRLPCRVRDEFALALLHLPFAQANIKWKVSERVSAIDSTVTMGGGVVLMYLRV